MLPIYEIQTPSQPVNLLIFTVVSRSCDADGECQLKVSKKWVTTTGTGTNREILHPALVRAPRMAPEKAFPGQRLAMTSKKSSPPKYCP